MINRYLFYQHIRNNRLNNNRKVIYLRVPFVDCHSERYISNLFSKSPLPVLIRPIFITPQPLSKQLRQTSAPLCGEPCICDNKSLCLRKNIVYEIQCKLCTASYIGETHRTFRSRILEHLSQSTSKVFNHVSKFHKFSPLISHISFKIKSSGFKDTLQRKSFEFNEIKKFKPTLNIQNNQQ